MGAFLGDSARRRTLTEVCSTVRRASQLESRVISKRAVSPAASVRRTGRFVVSGTAWAVTSVTQIARATNRANRDMSLFLGDASTAGFPNLRFEALHSHLGVALALLWRRATWRPYNQVVDIQVIEEQPPDWHAY